MTKTHSDSPFKSDFRDIPVPPARRVRGPGASPLHDEVDRARSVYLRAVTAWQAQAKPTDQEVADEATGLANAYTQVTMVVRRHRHGR